MSINWELAGVELLANFAANYFYLSEWQGGSLQNIAVGWVGASIVGIATLLYPYLYLQMPFWDSFLYWFLAGGLGAGIARLITHNGGSQSWLK